jgi:hypothetical protein
MPAGIQPTPSDAPVGQSKKGSAPSVQTIPFARASKWHIEQSNIQAGIVLGPTSQIFNFPIASYGYLSAVLITVQLTGGAGGVALTYFEDAPWSLLSQVQFSDVNGVPIFQLSGFHAYLAAKYGGYRPFAPDAIIRGAGMDGTPAGGQAPLGGGPINGALTGANGLYYSEPSTTTGNTKFLLPIFFEFGLDGLGALPNMDASARYNLQLTVAGNAFVASPNGPYTATATTEPTTPPTMTITVEILARSQPPAQDMFGNINSTTPPAVGTVQYWTAQTASGLANGANTIQLTRVGNLIRNHLLVFRDSSNPPRQVAETGGDVPQLFEFDWDVGQRYVANVATLRWINAYLSYGFDVPNGCIILPNTLDPDKMPFSEYGDEWMGTVGATKLTLRFSTTVGNGSLTVLTNDIVPASSQVYAAPALQTM